MMWLRYIYYLLLCILISLYEKVILLRCEKSRVYGFFPAVYRIAYLYYLNYFEREGVKDRDREKRVMWVLRAGGH